MFFKNSTQLNLDCFKSSLANVSTKNTIFNKRKCIVPFPFPLKIVLHDLTEVTHLIIRFGFFISQLTLFFTFTVSRSHKFEVTLIRQLYELEPIIFQMFE